MDYPQMTCYGLVSGWRSDYHFFGGVPSDIVAILEPGVCTPGRMHIHAARWAAPGAVGDFRGVGGLAQQPPSRSANPLDKTKQSQKAEKLCLDLAR